MVSSDGELQMIINVFDRLQLSNNAIVRSTLRPWRATHDVLFLIVIVLQNLLGIDVGSTVMLLPLRNTYNSPQGRPCGNIRHPQNRKYIATPPEEDRATDIGNMHKNLVKFGYAVFELCKRTNKQMAMLIKILRIPPRQK